MNSDNYTVFPVAGALTTPARHKSIFATSSAQFVIAAVIASCWPGRLLRPIATGPAQYQNRPISNRHFAFTTSSCLRAGNRQQHDTTAMQCLSERQLTCVIGTQRSQVDPQSIAPR